MSTAILNTPTQARKFVFFSNFKNSKRINWSERRNYSQ